MEDQEGKTKNGDFLGILRQLERHDICLMGVKCVSTVKKALFFFALFFSCHPPPHALQFPHNNDRELDDMVVFSFSPREHSSATAALCA